MRAKRNSGEMYNIFTSKIEEITETFTILKENQARIITTIDKELAYFTPMNVEKLKEKERNFNKESPYRNCWIQFQHGL